MINYVYVWFANFRLRFLGCLDQINVFTDIFLNTYLCMKFSMYNLTECLSVIRSLNSLNPLITGKTSYFFLIWQPPAFPYRHQYSIIGRFRLNHRVRDVDGCFPKAYRHQKYDVIYSGLSIVLVTRSITLPLHLARVIRPIRLRPHSILLINQRLSCLLIRQSSLITKQ